MSLRVSALLAACACALALALPQCAFADTLISSDDVTVYGSVFNSLQSSLNDATKYMWLPRYYTNVAGTGTSPGSVRYFSQTQINNSYSGSFSYSNAFVSFCLYSSGGWPSGVPFRAFMPRYITGYTSSGSTRFPLNFSNCHVFGWSDSETGYVEIFSDSSGFFKLPPSEKPFVYLYFAFEVGSYSTKNLITTQPFFLLFSDSATQSQTDQLMSVDGADSIASGQVDSATSQLDDSFGFMQQVASLTGKFTDISADSDSVVRFPGIAFGSFSLPAQDVDIWAGFEELRTPCKVICTGVLILLWIHGVQSLYGRIFHNEVDVINDDD